MIRSATFSPDRRRRFDLVRDWRDEIGAPDKTLLVCGLNPSKAGESSDDPTVRKTIGFGRRWGFGRIVLVNLNPIVSTDPWDLPPWCGQDAPHTPECNVTCACHGPDCPECRAAKCNCWKSHALAEQAENGKDGNGDQFAEANKMVRIPCLLCNGRQEITIHCIDPNDNYRLPCPECSGAKTVPEKPTL